MISLYGHNALVEATIEGIDLQPYVEMFAYDDLSRLDSQSLKEFCQSAQAQVLQEKQVLKKGTLMRLSRQDDEKRRIKLCVYQLARAEKNPHWKRMIDFRKKWREERDILMKQYGKRAEKIAKASQKEYIKKAQKMK